MHEGGGVYLWDTMVYVQPFFRIILSCRITNEPLSVILSMSSVSHVTYKISSFLQPFHMMVQSVPFIVFATALLIKTLSYCSAENVYCVIPTATSCSSCPHNTHCATLSEYAQEAELYFTSNTTMVFLPGDHVLDTNITVANVTRLTMWGESSSDNITTFVRNGSVGFSFTNMVDFKILSLAFTSYNRSSRYGSHPASNSALFLQSTQNAKLVNCSFHDNLGTALTVHNTSITLVGNMFIHNQCGCKLLTSDYEVYEFGCGITALSSNLIFTGNTLFLENSQTSPYSDYCAGAIWASASSLHFINGTNNFTANSGEYGGAIYVTNTLLSFNSTCAFSHNSANEGGAIFAQTNTFLSFIGTSNFCNNSAKNFGGAIQAYNNTILHFSGTNNFIANSAQYGGAIDAFINVVHTFDGTNNFINNSAESGGGAIVASFNISMTFAGTNNFCSNSAIQGGAISASYNSTLRFDGNISFTNNGNNTSRGGAMYLYINVYFYILPSTTVYLESNRATLGGAIFVFIANPLTYCTQVARFIPREECFFQLSGQNLSSGLDVQLVFNNNSADIAGSVLYGSTIDNCTLTGLDSNNSGKVFDMLVNIEGDTDYNTTSTISSDSFRVCPCEAENLPNCSKSIKTLSVHPGETIQVSVVAVGQRDGIVPAQVRSRISNGRLLSSQTVQQTTKMCTTLNYTVFSLQKVTLELYADGPCSTLGDELVLQLGINQTCPSGFTINYSSMSCVCNQTLQKYTNNCNITNGIGQISRKFDDMFWVGYDQTNHSHGLILHPNCPFDYCVKYTVVFPLNNTDMQCAHNRAGLLCGACKTGYSLVLGTFQCRKCNKKYDNLALLIPFAGMGIALVFLLFVCKLTVATGTISGLVFYANIIEDNHTMFLPGDSTDPLSVFIAWLNLDFGIETCFYDGMDAYSKTWLNLVFPVYLWVLVGLMILISHYSQRFANLLGNNPVSVLATLILLSFATVIRTFITAVPFTYLEYQNYNKTVWLYDANVGYLISKHCALFAVAVIGFLFFFLCTLLLLFGQWLQSISHLRFFSWVNNARLKPFMDSYHAPYKPKHRYWPGLLLVLRFLLLLVFAFNYQQDPSINLLAILVGAGLLQLWAWVSGGVYKNWCLDALEGSFVLNLIMLVGATYYFSEGNQLAVGYTSVSIALITFIGILAYHIFQQLKHTKLWKKVPKLNLEFKKLRKKLNKKLKKKLNTKQTEDINLNDLTNDRTESVKFDQLREPLLDDLPQPTHSVV